MKRDGRYLLDRGDYEGIRMAADIARKVIYQLKEKLTPEELTAHYIKTMRQAYNDIRQAFEEDAEAGKQGQED